MSEAPLARAAFIAAVERSRKARRNAERQLAWWSVVGGVAQLALIRWGEPRLARGTAAALFGGIFVLYIGAVVLLLRRLDQSRRERPRCPQCGRIFDDVSVRIVTASSHCDGCGHQVIAA